MIRPAHLLFLSVAVASGLASIPTRAQMSTSDMIVRLDQLENQMRQLTGTIEQLQFRNQQLEQSLRRMQEDIEFRFQELGGKAGARSAPPRPGAVPAAPPPAPAAAPPAPGRRSDAFDPSQSPGAPGAPRTLGTMAENAGPSAQPLPPPGDEQPVGAPNGRPMGAPLDLSTMSANAAGDTTLAAPGGQLPPRNPGAGGALATLPPSQSPRDEFDLAYGYVLHKDYALAEQTFRDFLRKYPSDRLAGEAQFWLGESMFQRQSYRDAADAFLTLTKKYDTSTKAPDALLRLGQSLAALHEKELACATFAEVGRKFPRAAQNVKAAVEREQKRVHC
jgi:tol-pal system protein YbgF